MPSRTSCRTNFVWITAALGVAVPSTNLAWRITTGRSEGVIDGLVSARRRGQGLG